MAKNCLQAAKSSAALADGERYDNPKIRIRGAKAVRRIDGMYSVYSINASLKKMRQLTRLGDGKKRQFQVQYPVVLHFFLESAK